MDKYPEDDSLVAQYAQAAEDMIESHLGYSPVKKEYLTRRYGDDGFLFELAALPLIELTYADVNGNELDAGLFRVKSRNYLELDFGRGRFCKDSLYTFKYTAGYEVKTFRALSEESENADPLEENQEGGEEAESGTETLPDPLKATSAAAPAAVLEDGLTEDSADAGGEEEEEKPDPDSIAVNKVPAKIRTAALQIASLLWESAGGNLAVSSTSYADSGSRTFSNYSAERILKDLEPYRLASGGNF